MADPPTDQLDQPGAPGSSPAAPAGTAAVAVYSDLRCPWAHVAVRRLLDAAERRGVESEVCVDHRWFPLDEGAVPVDGREVDRMLAPFHALEPDARWHRWSDAEPGFPQRSRLAAAWVQGAKRVSPAASMALDRALREALFADGRDISDEQVLADVAAGVAEVEVDLVRSEVASGRPDEELEHHERLVRSDLVPASPTIALADGTTWTNPGIRFHLEDGVPVVDDDDPGVHDEILDAFLARRHYD